MQKNKKINNKTIIGIVVMVLGLIFIAMAEKFLIEKPLSIDRLIIFCAIDVFVCLNIIIDFKKLWNFIYANRYKIGVIIFTYTVLMGYNGSSMYSYNLVIEPDYEIKNAVPIIGQPREVRSDEYWVGLSSLLSQYSIHNDFSPYNYALMGRTSNVSIYPQLPTKTLSILTNIRLIGFLFLDIEQAFSFYWYLPYFMLFFALFELFMILTKKNKILSLFSAIILECSPSLLWWDCPSFLLYGSLATIFFYNIFHSSKKWQKLLFSVLLGWAGASYIIILYPAWQISYGYLFLILFIYCIIDNKKNIKWTDFLYLIITVLTIVILIVPTFINSLDVIKAVLSTEYPGKRNSIGGTDWEHYYNYFSSIFYSFKDAGNPCQFGQYMSLYPIPILWGAGITIFNIIKKRKLNFLITSLTVLALLMSIWNYVPIGIFSKVFLLSMSMPSRTLITVSVISTMLIVLLMNEYENKILSNKKKIIYLGLSIIMSILGLSVANKNIPNYMNTYMLLFSLILFVSLFYLFMVNTKTSKKIFMIIMSFSGIMFWCTIMPVNKGLDIMFEKPLAKEIQKLNAFNKNAIWLAVEAPQHLNHYIAANGARIIDSTNYYPNLELWKKIDPDLKYNEVYNRYAHISADIVEEETSFELQYVDHFIIHLNKNDICKLNIDYIATTTNLNESQTTNLTKIYQYSDVLIYKTNCNP